MTKVWEKARGEEPFDESAAIELASELVATVKDAEGEWHKLKSELVRTVGTGIAGGIMSAGPAIANGYALWLGAAAAVGTVGTGLYAHYKNKSYGSKYPAAFFMKLEERPE